MPLCHLFDRTKDLTTYLRRGLQYFDSDLGFLHVFVRIVFIPFASRSDLFPGVFSRHRRYHRLQLPSRAEPMTINFDDGDENRLRKISLALF